MASCAAHVHRAGGGLLPDGRFRDDCRRLLAQRRKVLEFVQDRRRCRSSALKKGTVSEHWADIAKIRILRRNTGNRVSYLAGGRCAFSSWMICFSACFQSPARAWAMADCRASNPSSEIDPC